MTVNYIVWGTNDYKIAEFSGLPRVGDIIFIDDDEYTCFTVKEVSWQKNENNVYMPLINLKG